MKRNNNFTVSKTENFSINSDDNDNLDSINSLKELYDYYNSKYNSKDYKDEIHGKIPQKNDNNNSNKYDSRINKKENKYGNKHQNSDLINNQNKIHLNLKSTDKKEEDTINSSKNRNNGYHEYKNGINNYRGWKGRGRGNWRGRDRGNWRGRGSYRGKGRGKYRNYNNYCYFNDNNDFYENKDGSKNKTNEAENKNREINGSKNNDDYYSNLRNGLHNSDSESKENDDDKDNEYYKLFSNDALLNSLSDLNLNLLFNGLDLIGCNIYEDMGSLTLIPRSFRDELIFNLREDNKGLTKEFVDKMAKIKIDAKNKKSINPNKCVICTEVFKEGDEVIKVLCHHYFHSKCIMEWFELNNYCPICRFILEEEKKD